MILVRDVIQLKRENISPNKLAEFDWYSNLEITIEEFGYLIHCECGDEVFGFMVNDQWIKTHFEHRDVAITSVIAWLENYENNDC